MIPLGIALSWVIGSLNFLTCRLSTLSYLINQSLPVNWFVARWLAQGISFAREGNFANLARANHREFSLNTYNSICFRHATNPCILLSFVMVERCYLLNARHACNNQKGEAQFVKSIEGFHHSVEYERLQSTTLEIYGVETMPAPMAGSKLTFSLRVSSGGQFVIHFWCIFFWYIYARH